MKKQLLSLFTALSLAFTAVPYSNSAFAAGASIHLNTITDKKAGDSVTLSGTTDLPEVSIKVMRPNNTILFVDVVTPSSGFYSDTFTLPSDSPTGTYTVVVGQGTNVSKQAFQVSSTVSQTITVDKNNPTITLGGNPANITVPSGVSNAKIQLTPTETSSGKEIRLPQVDVQSATNLGTVKITIPDGTKITASKDWDGTIQLPTVLANNSVTGVNGNVSAVIEVGSPNVALTFDKAVRILVPGQAGKSAGYVINNQFTQITRTLNNDSQEEADNLPVGREAIINKGSDLVIWTKHFTKFVTYTPTTSKSSSSSSSGGGGGGGGGSTASVTSFNVSAANGGTITSNGVTIQIPANAVAADINVTVNKVTDITNLPVPTNQKIVSDVFEIKKDKDGNFNKPVTIKLPFDKTKVDTTKYNISLFWYNEETKQWVELDNVSVDPNGYVSGTVQHFTKFAVLATELKPDQNVPKVNLSDVQGHWAQDYINQLVSMGAIGGYPDGTFKPDRNITRAEFTAILVKAFNLKPQGGKVFNDTANHWAKDVIATAASYGIVGGYSDTSFGPDDPITREQMAVMIVKAVNLPVTSGDISFKDQASISPWAVNAIETAAKNNIMSGYPDGSIQPHGNATRAEAATVIVKALHL